jgi:diaminohydroxyphosphoribosylaminopyrimidine deaminase/5-amino-6-(5-phosphoribosylamino)uracil reductase
MRAHAWRADRDAVVVGIGTALADDPALTARIPEVVHQPRRVVFDSEARLPLDSQLVRGADEVPLTVVVSRAAPRTATDALEVAGAEVIVATGENEPARVRSALDQLGASGITSVLLEGGPHLAGAFLDAGEVDQLALFIAPVLLGGAGARDPLEGEGVEQISEAVRALSLETERIGDDVLICARIREW